MDDQQKKIAWSVGLAVVITFVIAWLFFGNDKKEDVEDHNGPGRISGEITFNALTPEEGDEGEITFAVRKHNSGSIFELATVAVVPNFDNGGQWMISELEENVTYDIQATLSINSEEITKSQITTATAPASDVDLALTITWQDLPNDSVAGSQNKKISGELMIHGYIPEGATYTVFTAPARDNSQLESTEIDDPQFSPVVSGAEAHSTNVWIWDRALAQVDYLVRAELYTESGDYIGTSDIENAVVPQDGVLLTLQSKASTEPTKTPISGTVVLNGGYKSDSEVVVQVRENGAGGFADVDKFPAESTKEWVYTDAKTGVAYNVRAVLERQGEELARSNQQTTTAPAKNIKLTINTDLNLDDPIERPEIVSCEEKDDDKYDAKIRFPGVDSARSYWIRVGKHDNSGDRFNESEEPSDYGQDVEVTIRIDDDRYYYADYAYSYCSDCETLDSYSDFSSSLKFYCGDEPDDE